MNEYTGVKQASEPMSTVGQVLLFCYEGGRAAISCTGVCWAGVTGARSSPRR